MKFIPHDYQSYCTEYIKTHPIAALFLDIPDREAVADEQWRGL